MRKLWAWLNTEIITPLEFVAITVVSGIVSALW